MAVFMTLFGVFFQIGLFTIGGGYAMIPLIQREVLSHGWMTLEQFVDFIAVSESTPGPLAVNMATFVGNELAGVLGGVVATLAVVLPSFLIILLVAKCFSAFSKNRVVNAGLYGIKAAVVGLIFSAALTLCKTAFLTGVGTGFSGFFIQGLRYPSLLIFAIILFISVKWKKVSPVLLILLSAALGILFFGGKDILALMGFGL